MKQYPVMQVNRGEQNRFFCDEIPSALEENKLALRAAYLEFIVKVMTLTPHSREQALAKTALQESYHWAIDALKSDQDIA